MIVNCEQVWLEISNYIEGDIDANVCSAIELHFRGCKHCKAVLEGTRNVIQLYADERIIEAPLGFHHRLHRTLEQNIQASRRKFLAWTAAAAAALVVTGSFEVARFSVFKYPNLRSQHAQPGSGVPPDAMVVVSSSGKVFHGSSGCPFIHDKAHVRIIAALKAINEGYTPCVRCSKKYLQETSVPEPPRQTERCSISPS